MPGRIVSVSYHSQNDPATAEVEIDGNHYNIPYSLIQGGSSDNLNLSDGQIDTIRQYTGDLVLVNTPILQNASGYISNIYYSYSTEPATESVTMTGGRQWQYEAQIIRHKAYCNNCYREYENNTEEQCGYCGATLSSTAEGDWPCGHTKLVLSGIGDAK